MEGVEIKYTIGDRIFNTASMRFVQVTEVRVFINPGNNLPMVMYRVEDMDEPGCWYECAEDELAKSPADAVRKLNSKLQILIARANEASKELAAFLESLPKLRSEIETAAVDQPEAEPQTETLAQQEKGKGWHYKSRRTCHQWKENEEALVHELFDRGVSYNGIAEALENKFGFKVSVAAIKQRVRKAQ